MSSNVLQRIASIHQTKINKYALVRQKKFAAKMREKLAFEDTQILEIWNEVKAIEVRNFAPRDVDGVCVPLENFFDTTAEFNICGTGLVLFDSRGCSAAWYCQCDDDTKNNSQQINYRAHGTHFNDVWHADANNINHVKEQFTASFIKWLARRITPEILVKLGVDMTAQVTLIDKPKTKRKVSKVTNE